MKDNESIDEQHDAGAGARRPGSAGARGERSTPRGCALRTEALAGPARGSERFHGYGVIALPFESGELLAFRRFAASSIGPAYASIWHRDRAGEWTFYVTIEPTLACPRYFGDALARVVVTDIATTWVGHDHLVVSAPGPRVEWSMRIEATLTTRLLGGVAGLALRRAWATDGVLSAAGTAAGIGLGTGPLRLAGLAPNGQRFRIRPRRLWRIDASAAQVEGRELGPVGGRSGAELGEFRLPGTGIFACGEAEFESLDTARHSTTIARRVERLEDQKILGGVPAAR